MDTLSVCMSRQHMRGWFPWRLDLVSDSLGLQLQRVVSFYLGVKN